MFVHRTIQPKDKTFIFLKSKLSYSVIGSGRSVILLHGSMIADPWSGFEKILAKYYKVYILHLPGFGASDCVKNELHNSELFATALAAFIKHEKLTQIAIIALSLGTVVTVKAVVRNKLKNKLILVGTPVGIQSEKLKNASLIPIWMRRLVGSTAIGRSKVLIPVLRDIIGKADKKSDIGLLKDLQTTDTKSLVDINVHSEVELQMPKLLQQLKNETYFIYGDRDKLLETSKHLISKPILIENADHNTFESQPEITLEVIRSILQ